MHLTCMPAMLCVCVLPGYWLCGCKGREPTEEDILAFTKQDLQERLQYIENPHAHDPSVPANEKWIGHEYILDQVKAAIAFLDGRKTLDGPYMINAELHIPGRGSGNSNGEGALFIEWLEYATEPSGIIWTTAEHAGSPGIKLPVLEDVWRGEARAAARSMTAWRWAIIPCVLGDGAEPALTKALPREDYRSTVALVLPRNLEYAQVHIAVYDTRASVSNAVKLFCVMHGQGPELRMRSGAP